MKKIVHFIRVWGAFGVLWRCFGGAFGPGGGALGCFVVPVLRMSHRPVHIPSPLCHMTYDICGFGWNGPGWDGPPGENSQSIILLILFILWALWVVFHKAVGKDLKHPNDTFHTLGLSDSFLRIVSHFSLFSFQFPAPCFFARLWGGPPKAAFPAFPAFPREGHAFPLHSLHSLGFLAFWGFGGVFQSIPNLFL